MITTKKLIEVALPLEAINKASAKEKSIRHGHPNTLHLWWARRPLAAARAVIFAQMVDDPSSHPDIFRTEKAQEKERKRLFKIIEDLVQWENITNEGVLQRARDEIWASWRATCAANADHPRAKELFNRNKLPGFHDPFAGGGALPLEAQRLGLEAYATDLNPVAVLINKAMIEIPPKFAGRPPVNPDWQEKSKQEKAANPWKGAQGLAEDVRYYGKWMRDEAEKRIGHLYPKVEVTEEMATGRLELKPLVGEKLTVVAWLWARTVRTPNPAFAPAEVPLTSSFVLSSKPGREAYVEPVVEGSTYRFLVRTGKPQDAERANRGTRSGKAQDFLCLLSGVPIPRDYIRDEGKGRGLGARLMAIVAEGPRGRIYLPPERAHEIVALNTSTDPIVEEARLTFLAGATPTRAMITGGVCSAYGLTTWGHLFTSRQLIALTTFSDVVQLVRDRALKDARLADFPADTDGSEAGGTGAIAYADAIAMYLAFAVSKAADRNSSLCFWESPMDRLRGTFGRQSLPMVWDYAETNPFAGAGGDIYGTAHSLCEALDNLATGSINASAQQADAQLQTFSADRVVSTDPPYYDNIAYADLSDFFYVWLRRSLRTVFPSLFATIGTPKAEELIATRYRHGTQEKAEAFFMAGMTRAMKKLSEQAHPAFPVAIYYAFKQSETGSVGTASTGWETFLDAVISAGFGISGTWPVRTELTVALKKGTNVLASSIVLVCRHRSADAATTTRRDFLAALKAELPAALAHLQGSNIAPVDLAQAAIGPGMAVYSRYARVVDAEGKPVTVRDALSLINQTLDEVLAEQEGDFDADTRWSLAWFEQNGFDADEYGIAETLSKAKNTSVAGLVDAGLLSSKGGKVRLLKPSELPDDWDPGADTRLTVWEMVHHLIRVLEKDGEAAAGKLVAKIGAKVEVARELAYRLYALCDRKKRAPLAGSYNGLVQSWPELSRLAREPTPPPTPTPQTDLFATK